MRYFVSFYCMEIHGGMIVGFQTHSIIDGFAITDEHILNDIASRLEIRHAILKMQIKVKATVCIDKMEFDRLDLIVQL